MKWIKLNRDYTLFFLLVIAPFQAFFAQDIQLTQFYSAPCFLNPALAGDESCARLTTNFRKQWPGAGNGYTSTLVSYDSYVHKIHGGLGFLF